ncbi:c-type cytochrome biogenesis protein CcmI [Phenylobacterium sp.]|uniref:c-type cytochrome biogenesis protein CcmI n=1 Tax=Phenylobacterium sp. TaxID=1871053 RepID=UPI002C036657|nr:c-type cytochrome biogenesis protein CcmI [Phenylobacterium sp.]HVI34378.1 c-type cytochrome biogenesis protein CcmI [Phenylobacterium sp.]
MIVFWAVAGVLSAAAAGLILFRAAQAASQGEAPDPTPILYRRQLSEIDDLAERGLIGESERRVAHAEAARRLLAATEKPGEAWRADRGARMPVLAAVVLAPMLALGLYLGIGAPGMPDQPFAQRLETWRTSDLATLQPAEIAAVLNRLTRERKDDPELYRFLAMAEASANNPTAAVRALRRAVALAPERADLWTLLGEAYASQAGEVDDAAQEAFREALKRDPKAVEPRFYLGRQRILSGDRAGGVSDWRALLAELPPGDPRAEVVRRAIAEAESMPTQPGFSGDQMAAIRGMVEGLAARLKTNPDDPEGWVRLVRAYAVLGETAQRDAALATARGRYAGKPEILNQLAQAARAEPMR